MRVTLDSSVLVAAHISRAGVCAELMEEILLGHELVLSEFILGELQEKLCVKFGFPRGVGEEAATHLRRIAEIYEPKTIPSDVCRDVEDLAVLGTAVAGHSTLLVTVDKDLLTLGTFREIAIVKPGEFWRRLRAADGNPS